MTNGFKGLPGLLQEHRATDYRVLGKNGATAGGALAGATTGGSPTSGTFEVGDVVVDRTGALWVCTTAGSPGTWKEAGLYYRGAWSNTTTYGPNDLVTYNNQLWVAGTTSTGTTPTVSSLYAATVLADSPTVYYRLGDAVGSTSALDSSGGSHTGIIDGTITFGTAGAIPTEGDTAATFNPGSALVEPIGYGNPQVYTLELWFKTVAAVEQYFWQFNDTTGLSGGSLDRHALMASSGQVSGDRGNTFSAASYNDGHWHHFVVTNSGSNNKTYVDGVLTGSSGYSGANFNGFWMFGNAFNGGYKYWNGSLDEVALYAGTALSSSRVTAHYNAATSPNPWSLVAINPMTTQGDLVYGGSGGMPTRLPAGANNTLLAGGTTPAFTGTPTLSGELTASDFKPSGLSGATSASRYVGATASGAPASGTFAVGDYIIDRTGKLWICTAAGTPGTWTQTSGASPLTTKGDLYGHSTVDARVPVGSDGTFLAADSSQATGLSYKFPAGIAGVSTLSTALSANVTMTSANTYYDGPSLSLTAGTWLLIGAVNITTPSGVPGIGAKLWDGTTTYASDDDNLVGGGYAAAIPLSAIVSPTSTTTYKISATSQVAGSTILAARTVSGAGNNASYLSAIQLTGAPASGPGALMPAVRVSNSAAVNVSNAVDTIISFDTTALDQGTSTAQHSNSTNNSRLTCQQAGVYLITGNVEWVNQNSTGQRIIRILLNGTTEIASSNEPGFSSFGQDEVVSVTYKLNVGDYVELRAYQTSGVTSQILQTSFSPTFGMARIDSGPGAVQPNTKVQLDYAASTDLANNLSLPATTWTDIGTNQSFIVDDQNSVVEISVSGNIIVNGNTEVGARIVIDSAGTPINKFIAGNWVAGSALANALAGSNVVSITGLTAGTHTVKLQLNPQNTVTCYCRAASFPTVEALLIRVLERKQSSSPPSSTPAPAVRCYNSASISVPNITVQALTFDTNRIDQGTSVPQHSTSSNTNRLTCQQAGMYQINAGIEWVSNGTGQRTFGLRVNGTTTIAENQLPAGNVVFGQVVSTNYYLNVGDYVEAYVYQSSGGVLNINAAGNYSPEFGMARLDTGALPSQQWQTKTANYTALPTDYGGILADATSGNLTVTLPTAVGAWQEFTVKKRDSSANTVTVGTTASQTIDGASTYVISTQYESVTVVSDGQAWFIK